MSEPTNTLITGHTWRPPQNAHLPLKRLDRPCEYMNCRRPRTEHARASGGQA